jgi:hypothetical protein
VDTDTKISQIDAEIAQKKTVDTFGMSGDALYGLYGTAVGEAVIATPVNGGCVVEFAEGKGIVPGVRKAFLPQSKFDVSGDTSSKVMVEPHSKFPLLVRLVGVSRRGDSLVVAPVVNQNVDRSWMTFLEVVKRDAYCAYASLEEREFNMEDNELRLLFNLGRFGHCILRASVYVHPVHGKHVPYLSSVKEYQLRVSNGQFELTGKSRRVDEVEDGMSSCVRKPQEKNAELKTQADPIPTMGASALKKHLDSLRFISIKKVNDIAKSIAKRGDYPTRETLRGNADWWTSFKSLQAAAELVKEASE